MATCSCWRSGEPSAAWPANGSVSPAGSIAVCAEGERGLLSAALDPSFSTTGTIYVYATRPSAGVCRQHVVEVHDERRCRVGRIGASARRQHRVDGHQSQRRHGRGRPRRLPLPQRRRGRRHGAGTGPRLARRQDPANHDDGAAGAGQSVPHRRGPRSVRACGSVGRGVRRDLRPRSAQPLPYRLRSELDVDAVPHQRRRRRAPGRRSTTASAGANYGWPVREGPCAIGQTAGCSPDPNFTDAADRLPAHCRRVHRRWSLRAERLVGCRPTTAATCSPTARRTTCG